MPFILKTSPTATTNTSQTTNTITAQDRGEIFSIQHIYEQIRQELRHRIVGLDEIIHQIMICIFSGGHALLVGVPGLAKTLTIRSVAELLDLKFSRIQFTPDLMPSDITGTEILVQDEEQIMRHFTFLQGPIFANIILADEINRTPPKTQSALLEAMEEHTVTSMGQKFSLELPFFVLATQNPIEQEGTYPLPIAQLDRFMFNLLLDYPSLQEEYNIVRLTISQIPQSISKLLSQSQILSLLRIVKKIEMPTPVMEYAIHLCRLSRPQNPLAPACIKTYVAWGNSPRATQCLVLGGKARAMLHGREQVTPDDIRAIVHPIMRHRLLMNYQAEADNVTPDEVIDNLLEAVPAPDGILPQRHHKYFRKLYVSGPSM